MSDSMRLRYYAGEHACAVCRGTTGEATVLGGEHVCTACLRRLNADQGAKRAIMFAIHD